MAEQKMLVKMDELENKIVDLKEEVDYIKNMLEDSLLTVDEAKLIESTLAKLKKGDKSDFVSLDKIKSG